MAGAPNPERFQWPKPECRTVSRTTCQMGSPVKKMGYYLGLDGSGVGWECVCVCVCSCVCASVWGPTELVADMNLAPGASVLRYFTDAWYDFVAVLNLGIWVPNSDSATRCAGPLGKLLQGHQAIATTMRWGECTWFFRVFMPYVEGSGPVSVTQ